MPALMRCRSALAIVILLAGGACRYRAHGFVPRAGDAAADEDGGAEQDLGTTTPPNRPVIPRPDADPAPSQPQPRDGSTGIELGPPPTVTGPPDEIGCADGTRDGYLDLDAWTNIAACAGGWSAPGVTGQDAWTPRCDRAAGNSGANLAGAGCGIADLCAEGWHVCGSPDEVAAASPSDCEGAVPHGHSMFFLIAAGASVQGVCSPDVTAANDLHGCGTLGQPELEGCEPLDRRFGFADCLRSEGGWQCGDASRHLEEANLVTKLGPTLGGVLCCRDR